MNKDQLTTLAVAMVTSFIATFTGSALNLSIPAIGSEFQIAAASIGWIVNGFILASAALSVPFGRLADITGRRRILLTGIFLFAVSSGAAGFVSSMGALLVFRVLQGIGGAMIVSTNMAVLISVFPPEKRGKVLGYVIGATYTGLMAGPVAGGFLNHQFGWRSIFLMTFAVSIIVFLIAAWKLPKAPAVQSGQSMDVLGSLLYIAMIICILYGFSAYSAVTAAKYLILLGILLFALFVAHGLRAQSPVIQIRLFRRNRSYLLSNLAALLNYGATFALGYLLSIYLQVIKGYDSQFSGLILISQPLIMAILSPYAGRLSDRISPFKLASWGMALCALGLFSFTFVSADYPLYVIILNLFVVGLGFALFSSPNTNAVMACVEPPDYGVASSILATMRTIGQSASMAAVTFILAHVMGTIPLAEADLGLLLSAMRTAFVAFTCVCALGVFFSMRRKAENRSAE